MVGLARLMEAPASLPSELLSFSSQCPFHGKIIPRDDAGRPLHPEDRAWEQRQQLQRQAGRAGRSGGWSDGRVLWGDGPGPWWHLPPPARS